MSGNSFVPSRSRNFGIPQTTRFDFTKEKLSGLEVSEGFGSGLGFVPEFRDSHIPEKHDETVSIVQYKRFVRNRCGSITVITTLQLAAQQRLPALLFYTQHGKSTGTEEPTLLIGSRYRFLLVRTGGTENRYREPTHH